MLRLLILVFLVSISTTEAKNSTTEKLPSITYEEFKKIQYESKSQYSCDFNTSNLAQLKLIEASIYFSKNNPNEEPLHLITYDFKQFAEVNGKFVSNFEFINFQAICIKQKKAYAINQAIFEGSEGNFLGSFQVLEYQFEKDQNGVYKFSRPQSDKYDSSFLDIAQPIVEKLYYISNFNYKLTD
jgi:hypothetical protein